MSHPRHNFTREIVYLARPGSCWFRRLLEWMGFEGKMIPSVRQCFDLMEQYSMLHNIRAHSIMVQKTATLIALRLREAGEHLHIDLVTAGALMHDIGKTLCLHSKEDHAVKGAAICLDHHLEEIAGIVGEHIRLKNFEESAPISEREVVYYADKRVNHDSIVSLSERLDYLLVQYGRNEEWVCERIRDNFRQCKEVERKLFNRLPFPPEALHSMVK